VVGDVLRHDLDAARARVPYAYEPAVVGPDLTTADFVVLIKEGWHAPIEP
jgi:hypothetical protein